MGSSVAPDKSNARAIRVEAGFRVGLRRRLSGPGRSTPLQPPFSAKRGVTKVCRRTFVTPFDTPSVRLPSSLNTSAEPSTTSDRGCEADQTAPLQGGENVVYAARRRLEVRGLPDKHADHGERGSGQEIDRPGVRVLRDQPVRRENTFGKVSQVEGQYRARARADGSRNDMPIVRVGEYNISLQALVPADQAVQHSGAHLPTGANEPSGIEVRTVLLDVSEDLVQDPVRPARAHEVVDSNPDQKIAQRARVQHAGVVEYDGYYALSSPRPLRAGMTGPVPKRWGSRLVRQ